VAEVRHMDKIKRQVQLMNRRAAGL